MNETKVTVVGRVITDPKLRQTVTGLDVTTFRIASQERRYDRSADAWTNGDELFATVTCWRRLASSVATSLAKGDPVLVTGRLHTSEYEYQGQRRSALEIEAAAVGPDLTWCTTEVRRVPRRVPEQDLDPTDRGNRQALDQPERLDVGVPDSPGELADSMPAALS